MDEKAYSSNYGVFAGFMPSVRVVIVGRQQMLVCLLNDCQKARLLGVQRAEIPHCSTLPVWLSDRAFEKWEALGK